MTELSTAKLAVKISPQDMWAYGERDGETVAFYVNSIGVNVYNYESLGMIHSQIGRKVEWHEILKLAMSPLLEGENRVIHELRPVVTAVRALSPETLREFGIVDPPDGNGDHEFESKRDEASIPIEDGEVVGS